MATDLAEREKACCPFFQFSIEMDGLDGRLWSAYRWRRRDLDPLLNLTQPDSSAD